ncbi:MAG: hypothetical protein SFX72_22920 [Isosphaeraceae bacterium]|nr:hypothetical protein [Isosphaeraceae bacterium]
MGTLAAPSRIGRFAARWNRIGLSPWFVLALALAPATMILVFSECFVTQDGPAHLHNAHILRMASFDPSAFGGIYEIRPRLVPNWGGHLLALALDLSFAPETSERMLSVVTLIAFASSTLALRLSVSGRSGGAVAAVASAVAALNLTWFLGFTGFLLGCSLFAATSSLGWTIFASERPSARSSLGLAMLLVLGWFCHPVSLGLTVAMLAAIVWMRGATLRRLATLGALVAPLIPLGAAYLGLSRAGGGLAPTWEMLGDPGTLSGWKSQLGWVDPIAVAAKTQLPGSSAGSPWFALLAPSHLLAAALGIAWVGFERGERQDARRQWRRLGLALMLIGILAPDTLGADHGHYLPQRIVLIGLVVSIAGLDLSSPGRLGRARLAAVGFVAALAMQTLWVGEYARECSRVAAPMLRARSWIEPGDRLATVLADERNRFRVNPLLHVDCLLGVDSGAVVWSNYEPGHYYFPVQLRPDRSSPHPREFEDVARLVGRDERARRAQLWEDLLGRHAARIDRVISFGGDPAIERVNARFFEQQRVSSEGLVRVWSRRATFAATFHGLDSNTDGIAEHRKR